MVSKIRDYCDSCTEEADVRPYSIKSETFYWCDNCKEGEGDA
jgi:hypothetical protein